MKIIISISFVFLLNSCKQNNQEAIIPQESENISTAMDGVRTDAIDTLVTKQEIIDSLEQINE